MVTYVGDWETGDLREIHVVRPASGPKSFGDQKTPKLVYDTSDIRPLHHTLVLESPKLLGYFGADAPPTRR